MNIRNTLPHSLRYDAVNQPDNGCVICTVEQVIDTGQHIRQQIAIIMPDRTRHGRRTAVHGIMVGQIAVKGLIIGYLHIKGHGQIAPHFQQH